MPPGWPPGLTEAKGDFRAPPHVTSETGTALRRHPSGIFPRHQSPSQRLWIKPVRWHRGTARRFRGVASPRTLRFGVSECCILDPSAGPERSPGSDEGKASRGSDGIRTLADVAHLRHFPSGASGWAGGEAPQGVARGRRGARRSFLPAVLWQGTHAGGETDDQVPLPSPLRRFGIRCRSRRISEPRVRW